MAIKLEPINSLSSQSNIDAQTVLRNIYGSANYPLKNVLSYYSSYTYVLSLSVLPKDDYNSPDKTYMRGKKYPILCKTAGADPYDRILTKYGKFDFYIDNLITDNIVGFSHNKNSNVTMLSFDVIEPYSMGMFLLAFQTAALAADYENWRVAPILLTIEFKGNTQAGQMISLPHLTRYIPIRISDVMVKSTNSGTTYNFTAAPYNVHALNTTYGQIKSDIAVKGKTVQEILQSGSKSLQVVVNRYLKQLAADNAVTESDEIVIIFPKNIASNVTQRDSENNNPAAKNTSANSDIMKKIGVRRNNDKNLVQDTGECNFIGLTATGFGTERKGDTPFADDIKVWDPETKSILKRNMNIDITEGSFRFAQNSDIVDIINQVLLVSEFPKTHFNQLDNNGMRKWWRIDVQQYIKSETANSDKTNTMPLITVFRVVPYDAHSSRPIVPGVKPKGIESLKSNAIKRYEYIYTGQNSEVLRFDLNFSLGFGWMLPADNYKRSQDIKEADKSNNDTGKPQEKTTNTMPTGNKQSAELGTVPAQSLYGGTTTSNDRRGGSGQDDVITRAAKTYHDIITNSNDMLNIQLEIMGDPYWVVQSGFGTYTSEGTTHKDLCADGTVNYQNGEIDVVIDFKSPIDINQATGLYNFGGSLQAAPVTYFSGLYQINHVISTFKNGSFTQMLEGLRRPQSEFKTEATDEQTRIG